MKKTIAIVSGVVVVVAGGWLGATWYTGKRIEDANAAQIERANAYLASEFPRLGAKLAASSYDRGLFSSQARYALSSTLVDTLAAPTVNSPTPAAQVIWLDVNIEHGPFPKTAWAQGHFAPKMAYTHAEFANTELLAKVFALTGGKSPIESNATVSYNGDTLLDWSMPPVKYVRGARSLNFSGAEGGGSYVQSTGLGNGSLRVASIDVQGAEDEAGVHLTITGLEAKGESRTGKFGFGIGDGQVVAEQLVIGSKENELAATLTKPAYRVVINETDTTVGGEAAYSAENIRIGAVDLGTGEAVFKVSKLDGASVKAISQQYQKMYSALVMGTDDDALSLSMSNLSTMMGYGQQIMAGNPVVSVDPLLLKTDKGEQRANLTIEFGPVPMTARDVRETVIKSIKRVDASMHLSRPMAIDLASKMLVDVEKMPPAEAKFMAEKQVDQGMQFAQMFNIGKIQDDALVGKFSYANGVVNLNGSETPVEEFLDQFGFANSSFDDGDFESDNDTESNDQEEVEIEESSSGIYPMMPSARAEEEEEEEIDELEEVDEDMQQAVDAVSSTSNGTSDAAKPADEVESMQSSAATRAGSDRILNSLTTGALTPLLDDLGFDYTVGTDSSGDPHLKIDAGDTGANEIEVVFFSCSGLTCEDILMRTRFEPSKQATLSRINSFNRENRWARVFLDHNKVPVIEMDLNADGGMGTESLATMLQVYFSLVEDFGDEIGAR